MQVTFFNCHLTWERKSATLLASGSTWETTCGNIPILLRIGPQTTGTFFKTVSEASKAVYFLAQFLMSFLSLLNFFN